MAEQVRLVRKDYVLSSADIPRLEQCPAAGVYAASAPEPTTFPQWYGIFVHRFLQYAATRGREEALRYVRKKNMKSVVQVCERVDTDALPRGLVEVPYAHDVFSDTARTLPPSAGTKGMDPRREMYGRADLQADRGGCPHVVDYKCGALGDRDPAASPQLLGLAASVRASYRDPWEISPPGATRPEAYYVSFAGVRSSGEVEWATARLGDADLDAFVGRARRVYLSVAGARRRADEGGRLEFVPGPECGYCELRRACPTQVSSGAPGRGSPEAS